MISSMMHDLIYRPGHYRLHTCTCIAALQLVLSLYILKVDDEVVQNLNRKSPFLWIIK